MSAAHALPHHYAPPSLPPAAFIHAISPAAAHLCYAVAALPPATLYAARRLACRACLCYCASISNPASGTLARMSDNEGARSKAYGSISAAKESGNLA